MYGTKSPRTISLLVTTCALAATALAGERTDQGALISARPLARADSPGESAGRFTELDNSAVGLVVQNALEPANMRKYLLNGAGLCTGDYDADGWVDVYVVCQDGPNKLFRQTSPWSFEDVTAKAGDVSGGDFWGTGASFADIDNDGDLDLYVCNANGPNLLFVNQGDGTFSEEAERRGADSPVPSTMGSFADYDRDGDLDLYVVNNRLFTVAEENPKIKLRMIDGVKTVHPDFRHQYFILEGRMQEAGHSDQLLQNQGDGTFKDVSESAGIHGHHMGLSATWWDFDNDGWLDLYVGNDLKSPDRLYHNRGDGVFQDVLADVIPHTPWFSMGADTADLNGDGVLDFLIADMSSTTHYKQKTTMGQMGKSAWFLTTGKPRQFMRNACYLSTGVDRRMEAACLLGLDSTDWTWTVKFGDYDNDGRIDVFFTNGVGRNMNDSDFENEYARLLKAGKKDEAEQQILRMPALKEENLAFRNLGGLKFEDVSEAWGVNHLGTSNGATAADIDRDGDLDLLVSHINEPLGVYRNDSNHGNSALFELVGRQSNRNGIGARITVESAAGTQVRQTILARGYMSADEPLAHFGLGEDDLLDQVTIEWPSGIVQRFTELPVNQLFTVTEPDEPDVKNPAGRPKAPAPLFEDVAAERGFEYQHREKPYDDYEREPLLPNKLSQLGPGMAWADIDGDGDFDCFIGGAAHQAGVLLVNGGRGRFSPSKSGPWISDAACEDMGAVFVDADADGDQDLYVVSGGVECDAESPLLHDRLYMNDGSGKFERASTGFLPELASSGSCVVSADYDRDGDLDLFVGGRVIPGRWPLAAESRLLRNDRSRFVDVTDEAAPGLRSVGLVTGAVFSDANNDGWVDLLLALEWGPVTAFLSNKGQLANMTEYAGLGADQGWWNSIAAADIDNDGDMDYVATNFGLNTKYHASHEKPAQLYVNDFDKDGKLDLVEAEFEGETCFPIRGRSCSSRAMPFIKQKFETYHDFAVAGLSDIYTPTGLDESRRFDATRLESVVLINDGAAKFDIRELPRIVQVSPGFGLVMSDFDADGNCDAAMVQNFLHPQPETGQMDGGMGFILTGDGQGKLDVIRPSRSGLAVTGQGMGLTAIDFDEDGWPDLAVSTNDGPAMLLRNQGTPDNRPLAVRLNGPAGNRSGVGARVSVVSKSGAARTGEVHAGSGYLSQSSGELFFGSTEDDPLERIEVRWPTGEMTTRSLEPGEKRVVIGRK